MKGQLKRFRERQQQTVKRSYTNAVSIYEQTLQQVVAASPRPYGGETRELTPRLKPNEVYGVRCDDSSDYWKTVMLKRNELSGKFQVFISLYPIYGDPPDHMEVVSQEQVFKQAREMNAGIVMDNEFKAFPHGGQS